MTAMYAEQFGGPSVMQPRKIPIPQIEDEEILVRVLGTSVNTVDIFYRSGMAVMFGLSRLVTGIRSPKRNILGFDVCGKVVDVGETVSKFKEGDLVYGGAKTGANAEFSVVKETSVALKSSKMSELEAGVVPVAGLSALQGLRLGNIEQRNKVLIYGASGGLGTFAVQIAKSSGAEVTGVASGKNKELVIGVGADNFIDYTVDDFTKQSEKYDLIFDAVGKSPLSRWKNSLVDDGVFVNAGAPSMGILRMMLRVAYNPLRSRKIMTFDAKYTSEDLEYMSKLADEGKVKSVIEKTFPLEEVATAHQYYELGHTMGKLSVKINQGKS